MFSLLSHFIVMAGRSNSHYGSSPLPKHCTCWEGGLSTETARSNCYASGEKSNLLGRRFPLTLLLLKFIPGALGLLFPLPLEEKQNLDS